jgi:hypothetical protein
MRTTASPVVTPAPTAIRAGRGTNVRGTDALVQILTASRNMTPPSGQIRTACAGGAAGIGGRLQSKPWLISVLASASRVNARDRTYDVDATRR